MSAVFKFNEVTHNLDEKGRLSLPGKVREELKKSVKADEVTVTYRKEGYLAIYPYEQWRLIEEAWENITDIRVKESFARRYIATSETIQLDKAGRILLPAKLRDDAALGREVVIIGGINKVELWERGRLELQRTTDEELVESAMSTLSVPL